MPLDRVESLLTALEALRKFPDEDRNDPRTNQTSGGTFPS